MSMSAPPNSVEGPASGDPGGAAAAHPAPYLVATTGKPGRALDLADLSVAFEGGPRVLDVQLARRLGFSRATDIRKLVQRHRPELERHGLVARRSSRAELNLRHGGANSTEAGPRAKRGRPTSEYWLNEGQALTICALARTEIAAAIRQELIEVFMAYRHGNLPSTTVAPADKLPPAVTRLDAKMEVVAMSQRAMVRAVRSLQATEYIHAEDMRQILRELSAFKSAVDGMAVAIDGDSEEAEERLTARIREVAAAQIELAHGIGRQADALAELAAQSKRTSKRRDIRPPLLLDGAGIAQELGVSEAHARIIMETGGIRGFTVDGSFYTTREAVQLWLRDALTGKPQR